jgi:hypothetical protein
MTLRRPLIKKNLVFMIFMVVTSIAIMSMSFRNTTWADNLSACINLYNSEIVSLKITDLPGPKIIDPIAHPNIQFSAALGVGYTVTLTLHSAITSSSGSTNTGSLWYGSNARGYADDHCVNGVKPNTDITVTVHNVFMGQATHDPQPVEWYSWPLTGPHLRYTVHWR